MPSTPNLPGNRWESENPGDAPIPDWKQVSASDHFVQFYEKDSALIATVCSYISAGLEAGDACVVIATAAHRRCFEEKLLAHGHDLALARSSGKYVVLDAAETLASFMVSDSPDPKAFRWLVGGVIRRAAHNGTRVRVFGEMVALLWSAGNRAAAIRLEELWNELAQGHTFCLYCAYAIEEFGTAALTEPFDAICSGHSWVIPGESYSGLRGEDQQMLEIARLQQKAAALEAEVERRKALEEALVRRERDLYDFLENAVVPIHQVGPDGTILWANRSELDLLGYEKEEYVGHHIREFHADQEVVESMLERLLRGEAVFQQPARLRRKDGSIKHVLIDSNSCFEDEEFMYTRSFTTDITPQKEMDIIQNRLAAIVESSDDAIIGKSLDGTITAWNKGAERIFGYSADEVCGKPKTILFPADRLDEETEILARLRRGERTDHFETVRVCKDGRQIDVSLTISPIRDGTGNVIGASTIARDITESKQQRRDLAALNAHLKRLMMETNHRVKNNLQVIVAMIELQAFEHSTELAVPIEEFIRLKSHVRTLAIVHDLLTRGLKDFEGAERVSTKMLLEQLLLMLQQTSWNRTVRYEIEDAEAAPKQCVSLALVSNELVSNALKHGTSEADVTFAVNGSTAVLEVRDDGPGFPAGFDPIAHANTGLELIENLVRIDLAGHVVYSNRAEGGGVVRVTFGLAAPNRYMDAISEFA